MEPYPIDPLLVAGTAGTYAVAWSQPRQDWLVLRLTPVPAGHPFWTWVESDESEVGARRIAQALYHRDLFGKVLP